MKKSLEMKNKLEQMKKDAQSLLDDNKVTEAKAKMEEIKNMKAAIEIQEQLEEEEHIDLHKTTDDIENQYANTKTGLNKKKTKESANMIRAALKKCTGKQLTEAENSLLLPTKTNVNGANGEGYILPEDVRTLIQKKMREYKSLREVVGYYPAGALNGSFPTENFETVTGLIDFTDGTDGEESNDIKFTNVSYSLKEKAAFIKLSNTLLELTDNALIAYIVEIFSRKAVITENAMIIAALKLNKTVKTISGYKDLKKSINVDLDPAVLFGAEIVTNQDGFDYLDELEDSTGRPLLQPIPGDDTAKKFKGLTIRQYSNTMLPSRVDSSTKKTYAPIFYGNMKEGIKFVDLEGLIQFKSSSEAGFWSNTTVARLIEFIDVIQKDSSDKCYVYGEIEVGATK